MKFSGFLRTEEVVELAAFWFRVDGSLSKGILALDNMQDRPVKGTTDWNYYSLVLDIPDNAASVLFGVLLQGPGKVWADGMSLEEVDRSVPTPKSILRPGCRTSRSTWISAHSLRKAFYWPAGCAAGPWLLFWLI